MKVFISYAREDLDIAKKLRDDLENAGIRTWLDKENLLPGQNWRDVILREIRESRYFIALLSSKALSKEGFVQRELKTALDYLDDLPSGRIYFIPVRIDDCEPNDEKLRYIHWADLFPSYQEGLNQILRVLKSQENQEQTSEKPSKPQPPKTDKLITNSLGMKFVYIPPGTFMMGSPEDEPGRYDDEILHKVTLTKGFYMQTTTVTVAQWRAFVNAADYKSEAETGGGAYIWTGSKWEMKKDAYWNNPGFEQTDNSPITCVSWNDAQAFAKWLNQKDKIDKYRLPTEAEWEYACRAGTTTPFYFGKCLSTDQANYDGNYPLEGCPKGEYRQKTVPVGSFAPNAWGLHDMHGNVWEWCHDWYGEYSTDAMTDPTGPSTGSVRVLRGGGWNSYARSCRSAYRSRSDPGRRDNLIGFRLALSPQVSSPPKQA